MILLKLIGITSLLVLGYTIITQEGMGLYSIRQWAEKKVEQGNKWVEPIFICHWCQSSTWSLLGFLFAYGLGIISINWNLLLLYPLCVCGTSLVCGFAWNIHLMINAIKERNEAEAEVIINGEIVHEMDFENYHN